VQTNKWKFKKLQLTIIQSNQQLTGKKQLIDKPGCLLFAHIALVLEHLRVSGALFFHLSHLLQPTFSVDVVRALQRIKLAKKILQHSPRIIVSQGKSGNEKLKRNEQTFHHRVHVQPLRFVPSHEQERFRLSNHNKPPPKKKQKQKQKQLFSTSLRKQIYARKRTFALELLNLGFQRSCFLLQLGSQNALQ
jgi:hypothetical protein